MTPKVTVVRFGRGDVACVKIVRYASRTRIVVYDHWDSFPLIHAMLTDDERRTLARALADSPDGEGSASTGAAPMHAAPGAMPLRLVH